MKRTGFTFEVSARVDFTLEEATFLRERAREHFDHTCQLAAEPGVHFPAGLINAMIVIASGAFAGGKGFRWFSFREIDLLCKVLEPAMKHQPAHAHQATKLYFELKSFLSDLKAEGERIQAAGFGRASA